MAGMTDPSQDRKFPLNQIIQVEIVLSQAGGESLQI